MLAIPEHFSSEKFKNAYFINLFFRKFSRTFTKDESSELKFTTEDHKPMDAEERKRIYETGGFVRYNRVNGNLALSRAFGDFGKLLKTSRQFERQVETTISYRFSEKTL